MVPLLYIADFSIKDESQAPRKTQKRSVRHVPDILEDHAEELAVGEAGRWLLGGGAWGRARTGDHGIGACQVSLPCVAAGISQLDDAP